MRRDGRGQDARHRRGGVGAWCANTRAPTRGEHGDGLVRSRMGGAGSSGRGSPRRSRRSRICSIRRACSIPARSCGRRSMDDRALFRFKPGYAGDRLQAGARLVGVERAERSAHRGADARRARGGDPTGGFAKAVEMCNNNGHCRKFDAGTMCPSLPRDARRGASDARPRQHLAARACRASSARTRCTSDAVAEAMDLCVSCKGCKRDCPTGVDMARMKIEVKSARRMSKGLGLRDRADRRSAGDGAVGAAAAVAVQSRRRSCSLVIGFAKQRALPKWRGDTFLPRPTSMQRDATVVIFADTFSNNFEPEILHAARRVLEAARPSRRGRLARHSARARCAAAAPISRPGRSTRHATRRERLLRGAGAVRGARRAGRRAGAVVPVHAARRVPGAGPRRGGAQAADNALPVRGIPGAREEGGPAHARPQAAAAEDRAAARPLPSEGVRRHERRAGGAVAGARPRGQRRSSRAAAAWPAASATRPSTTTTSIAMAELSLLPAVRKADADALIVADGTSCRHQIADGSNRQAVHVARSAGTRARLRPQLAGMQQRPRNPYSSAEIDRASHERENEERMIELASSGAARFVPIDTEKNLVKTGGNPEAVFLQGMMAPRRRQRRRPSRSSWAMSRARRISPSTSPARTRRWTELGEFVDLRQVGALAVRARRLDPGLCPRHDLLASPAPLLRRVRRQHQGDARRPRPHLHQRELQDRAFPAHRSGGDHAGPSRRQVPAGPRQAFPARHALDAGGLRRAGRELRGCRGARGLRGGARSR